MVTYYPGELPAFNHNVHCFQLRITQHCTFTVGTHGLYTESQVSSKCREEGVRFIGRTVLVQRDFSGGKLWAVKPRIGERGSNRVPASAAGMHAGTEILLLPENSAAENAGIATAALHLLPTHTRSFLPPRRP